MSVKNNTVTASTPLSGDITVGIYVLSLASDPTPPFDPIAAAQSDLRDVTMVRNTVTAERVVRVLGFLDGDVINPTVVRNNLTCDGGDVFGIRLRGLGGAEVVNAKIIKNSVAACTTPFEEVGDVEDTKLPEGIGFPP